MVVCVEAGDVEFDGAIECWVERFCDVATEPLDVPRAGRVYLYERILTCRPAWLTSTRTSC